MISNQICLPRVPLSRMAKINSVKFEKEEGDQIQFKKSGETLKQKSETMEAPCEIDLIKKIIIFKIQMIDKKKLNKRQNRGRSLKSYPLLNFYILVAVFFEIIGQAFRVHFLQMLKPLPIILMIFYIHNKNTPRDHLMPSLIEAGLFVSLIGDVMLMFNEDSAFLVGTLFFGVSHIVYIVAFRMGETVRQLSIQIKLMRFGAYLVVCGMAALNIFMLWEKFPNKTVFVGYTLILAAESIAAISRYDITNRSSYYFILIGVGLFAVSDTLLAYLKFNAIKTDLGRFLIMFTYYGSQYFIMHGALHQSNLQFEIDAYQAKLKKNN